MQQTITIQNKLVTARYFDTFGLSIQPLTEIQLILLGTTSKKDKVLVDMDKVSNLFNKLYGVVWNNAVLAMKGTIVDTPITPVIYLDYIPSLENIALYIYEDMAPIIKRTFNIELVQVNAISAYGLASYIGC